MEENQKRISEIIVEEIQEKNMNKHMNNLVKVLFLLVIIAMVGASILQIFDPSFLGNATEYGLNIGWQREIGIWNLGMIVILIGTLLKGSSDTIKIVTAGAVVLGLGFGTNHLIGFIHNTEKYMSLVGALENYFLVAFLFFGLQRKSATTK